MNVFLTKEKKESLNTVISLVCDKLKISRTDLFSKKRTNRIARSRFITWYILHTKYSFLVQEIADEFGKKWATIQHGVESTKSNPDLISLTELITSL